MKKIYILFAVVVLNVFLISCGQSNSNSSIDNTGVSETTEASINVLDNESEVFCSSSEYSDNATESETTEVLITVPDNVSEVIISPRAVKDMSFKYTDAAKIDAIVGSVRDKKRLEDVFSKYRPQLVFHAAAHKHVPLMENNPLEAIKNNIFGTYNVVNCADEYNVERFVLISTDKAVNPTNIMGASKRVCEMIVQAKNKVSKTEYVAVRFGNVLGSNGSVIPLFKKQIAAGGPVTVTHKDITRFFMTIPEAVGLILQAVTYAKGGEIFVLDMGEPVKIYELAVSLIKLSGYEPEVDIPIQVTGLRPGEKLYEELLMAEEGLTATKHNKIFVSEPMHMEMKELEEKLELLQELEYMNNYTKEKVKTIMKQIVSTYREPEEVNGAVLIK